MAFVPVEAFLGGGEQALNIDVVRAALATVDSPGRLEIVRRSPTVLVDAAHNPAGARALRDAIEDSFTFARLVGVVAMMKDEEAAELLEALEPVLDEVVVTRTSSPRAMSPRQLGEIATDILGEHRVVVVDELPDALDRAAGMADEGGGVPGGVLPPVRSSPRPGCGRCSAPPPSDGHRSGDRPGSAACVAGAPGKLRQLHPVGGARLAQQVRDV